MPDGLIVAARRIADAFRVRAYASTTREGGWVIEIVMPDIAVAAAQSQLKAMAVPYDIRFASPELRVIVPQNN